VGLPKGAAVCLPESTAVGLPKSTSVSLHEGVARALGLHDSTSVGLPEGVAVGLLESTAVGLPKSTSAGLHEGVALGLHNSTSMDLPKGVAVGLQEGAFSHQAVKAQSVSWILSPRCSMRILQCYDEHHGSVNDLGVKVTNGGATIRPALKVMQDVFKGRDLAWARIGQALKGTTNNRKSLPEQDLLSIIGAPEVLPANWWLANKISEVSKKLLKKKKIKVVLDDAAYGSGIPTDNTTLFSTWPRANKEAVVFSSDEVRHVANMTKNQILCAGHLFSVEKGKLNKYKQNILL
jgi:hypothetical protein